MTVTRHLALWAACVSVTTAQHYDDTRDGLWHVCSPAWAVPQLDDDSLNADEAWRVEKYLARAACSSQTPIICQICAGLAARADGASNAPGTCGLRGEGFKTRPRHKKVRERAAEHAARARDALRPDGERRGHSAGRGF